MLSYNCNQKFEIVSVGPVANDVFINMLHLFFL